MFPGKSQLCAIECAEPVATGYRFCFLSLPLGCPQPFLSQCLGTPILRVILQKPPALRVPICELSTLALASEGTGSVCLSLIIIDLFLSMCVLNLDSLSCRQRNLGPRTPGSLLLMAHLLSCGRAWIWVAMAAMEVMKALGRSEEGLG